MGGGGGMPYESILSLALFFCCTWYVGRLAKSCKLPTIPFEIIVGMLFGPNGADLIPEFSKKFALKSLFSYNKTDEHYYLQQSYLSSGDFFDGPLGVLGFIGVGIVIFESGMHLSVGRVFNKDIGPHVLVIASLGTGLPILLGILCMYLIGSDVYPNALAAGFSLAPTSVGISLTLLSVSKQLNTNLGQIIMSSAFLDDIYSIICLVVMINLASGSFDPTMHVIVPLISSFALVGFGVVGSVYLPSFFPRMIDTTSTVGQWVTVNSRTMPLQDELQFFWMLLSYFLLSWLGSIIGSALLGCFAAGMLFSQIPRSHMIWERQFKRITRWLLRIFFSCTVAFSISITDLISAEAFGKGLLIGVVPCMFAKLICGYFTGPERWVIGIAMMARGEFAYLVAQEAHNLERLTDMEYAVVMWALLWATMVTPIVFKYVLASYVEEKFKMDHTRSERIGGDSDMGKSFMMHISSASKQGLVNNLTQAMHEVGMDVLSAHIENKDGHSNGTFEVIPKASEVYSAKYDRAQIEADPHRFLKFQMATDFDDDKLNEIAHHLEESVGDGNNPCVVIFEPVVGEAPKVFEKRDSKVAGSMKVLSLQDLDLNDTSLTSSSNQDDQPDKSAIC